MSVVIGLVASFWLVWLISFSFFFYFCCCFQFFTFFFLFSSSFVFWSSVHLVQTAAPSSKNLKLRTWTWETWERHRNRLRSPLPSMTLTTSWTRMSNMVTLLRLVTWVPPYLSVFL